VSPKRYGPRCSSVQPTKNWFFYFSQLTKFVNYENHPYVAPKFTKLFNMIEWKIRNNFPFGNKFIFETEFKLKFLEAKLLLNLGQIY
jgi:arsenate reductase-like glutaredoxin family protein